MIDTAQDRRPESRISGWVRPLRSSLDRFRASHLGRRVAHGAAWSLVGAVVSRGMAFVATLVVARSLGVIDFGKLGLVQTTVNAFATVSGFGLGLTATRFISGRARTEPDRAAAMGGVATILAFITGCLFAGVVALSATVVAAQVLDAPQLGADLRTASLLLVFQGVVGVQLATLMAFEEFRGNAILNSFLGVVSLPILLAGARIGGLNGVIWALVANSLLSAVGGALLVRRVARARGIHWKLRIQTREVLQLWRMSVPAALAGSIPLPTTWACNAIIARAPDGFYQVGLYNAAGQWRSLVMFVPAAIGAIVLPVLTKLRDGGEYHSYRKVLRYNLALNAAVAVALAAPGIALASPLMSAYGEAFRTGSGVLSVLALVGVVTAVTNVLSQAVASDGSLWWAAAFNALWAIVSLASTYAMRTSGAMGFAIAQFLAILTQMVAMWIFERARHRTDVSIASAAASRGPGQ